MVGDTAVVILAGGRGTRMESPLAKVLHKINERQLLSYVISLAQSVKPTKIVVVVGYQASEVRKAFRDAPVIFAEQKELLGTAHAVAQSRAALADFAGDVLILCGDVPLIRESTVVALSNFHRDNQADVTVMTTIMDDPASYGRVVRDDRGEVMRIVEFRGANDREKQIKEINTGIYCVRADFLFGALERIKDHNKQGEFYLTDIIAVAREECRRASAFILRDSREAMGINSRGELAMAEKYLIERNSIG